MIIAAEINRHFNNAVRSDNHDLDVLRVREEATARSFLDVLLVIRLRPVIRQTAVVVGCIPGLPREGPRFRTQANISQLPTIRHS